MEFELDEKTYMERILSERGGFSFMGDPLTGPPQIKSPEDVAFLFKNLESAASENLFAVFIKESGDYSVLYLSTGTPHNVTPYIPFIAAAAKEIQAESVTIVHNHPSGKIAPSLSDLYMHSDLRKALPIRVNDSIIINLDSGKFGVFGGEYGDYEETKYNDAKQEIPVNIYQFDKQKLYVNENERIKIKNPEDIAQFLSRQKRGVDKIQCIVLDVANQINRYCLYDGNQSTKELCRHIIADVGKHGKNVILATNNKTLLPTDENVELTKTIIPFLKKYDINVLDFLQVEQDEQVLDNYLSFQDSGLLSLFSERQAEYFSENGDAEAKIQSDNDRAFLEGELPTKPPKPKERLNIDDESPVFTKHGGRVNIRPIPQKSRSTKDVKKVLFSFAREEGGIDYRVALKGVFHDAKNGLDIATDGVVLMAIPNKDNKKTWTEGRDGKEIEKEYVKWEAYVPNNPVAKIPVKNLQPLIDKLSGIVQAQKFVNNYIVAHIKADGRDVFLNPKALLSTLMGMQSTGTESLSFEFSEVDPYHNIIRKAVLIRDAKNQKKFALIAPFFYTNTDDYKTYKTLVVPIEITSPQISLHEANSRPKGRDYAICDCEKETINLNPKNNLIMEKKQKTYVGNSFVKEFQNENGEGKSHVFNFQIDLVRLKDEIQEAMNSDKNKSKEIAINIEAKAPEKLRDGYPTHLVYIGDSSEVERREVQLFISAEKLLVMQPNEFGNIKLSAATRKEISKDLSSYSVYEDTYGTDRQDQPRNFVGRGYGAGENFGDTRVVGVATKHVFPEHSDETTRELFNKSKSYSLSIDENKVPLLKLNEFGNAKLSLIPYETTVTDDAGNKVKKESFLVSETLPKQKHVEANIEIKVANVDNNDNKVYPTIVDLVPQKNRGNDENSYRLIVADRNPETILSNKADLVVYADNYVSGMTKEEAKVANATKTYLGYGWTRTPSELSLSPADLTPEGLTAAIANNDGIRVAAVLQKDNSFVNKQHLELAQEQFIANGGVAGEEKKNRIINTVNYYLNKKELKQMQKQQQQTTKAVQEKEAIPPTILGPAPKKRKKSGMSV